MHKTNTEGHKGSSQSSVPVNSEPTKKTHTKNGDKHLRWLFDGQGFR